MGIVPSDAAGDDEQLDLNPANKASYQFAQGKDHTGLLLQSFILMDKVEDWVIANLMRDPRGESVSEGDFEEVRVRCQRLSELLNQHRSRVPADHYSLVQLLGWMRASESFYVLDFLSRFQSAFFTDFVAHCVKNRALDSAADLAMQRITALYRTELAKKIFGSENVDFVMETLLVGEEA